MVAVTVLLAIAHIPVVKSGLLACMLTPALTSVFAAGLQKCPQVTGQS